MLTLYPLEDIFIQLVIQFFASDIVMRGISHTLIHKINESTLPPAWLGTSITHSIIHTQISPNLEVQREHYSSAFEPYEHIR